jgi:hypothetical protein
MTIDNATTIAAIPAAVYFPAHLWWLPSLAHANSVAALILSILGIVWLGIKIGAYLFSKDNQPKD